MLHRRALVSERTYTGTGLGTTVGLLGDLSIKRTIWINNSGPLADLCGVGRESTSFCKICVFLFVTPATFLKQTTWRTRNRGGGAVKKSRTLLLAGGALVGLFVCFSRAPQTVPLGLRPNCCLRVLNAGRQ